MPKAGRIKHGVFQPRVRLFGSIPNLVGQIVEPIYLGLPPLTLTSNPPLIKPDGEEHVATISGIGSGSVDPGSKSPSKKRDYGSNQGINYGSDLSIRKKRRRKARTSTKSTQGKAKKKSRLPKLKKKLSMGITPRTGQGNQVRPTSKKSLLLRAKNFIIRGKDGRKKQLKRDSNGRFK